MGLPEALRVKAMQLFELYLDQLSEEDVHELTTGDQVLSRLRLDRRLVNARAKGIEDTYAFLVGKSVTDIRNLLSPMAPPPGSKVPAWINYTLEATFGRTYAPPPAPRSAGQPSTRTTKLPWDASEAMAHLSNSKSVPESRKFLNARATIPQLKELATLLRVSTTGLRLKGEIIDAILFRTIQAPGAFDRTQTN